MSVRGLVASSAVLFALALAADAQADDRQEKKVCAQASEEAQQLRTDGHPREARERLLVCVRDVCPQVVRKDCTLWLAEVEAALPSVVINARDGQGHDLVNVRVTLDGKPFTDKVDGKSIAVNPGIHVFRYEADDAPPIEEKVVVREGEKNRELVVTFKTPGPAVAPVPEPPTPPGVVAPSPAPAAHSGPPALTYVLAGVAVVAAGGYAYLGIQGKNDVDNLRSTCAPACSQSQKDSASQQREHLVRGRSRVARCRRHRVDREPRQGGAQHHERDDRFTHARVRRARFAPRRLLVPWRPLLDHDRASDGGGRAIRSGRRRGRMGRLRP